MNSCRVYGSAMPSATIIGSKNARHLSLIGCSCNQEDEFFFHQTPFANLNSLLWVLTNAFSGDVLPALGLAAAIPNRTNRCIYRTVELTLTSNRCAATCRDAPASTHSTNRVRGSSLHLMPPMVRVSNTPTYRMRAHRPWYLHYAGTGIPRCQLPARRHPWSVFATWPAARWQCGHDRGCAAR
jgi:hypothetical protein